MVANNLTAEAPLPRPWRVESKGQNSTFSEHDHVARQKSRMLQHGSKYFARKPPSPCGLGQKVKIQLNFQNMVTLHIKLKGMAHACSNMVANILPPSSHPGGGVKRSKLNFSRTWLCFISN